MVMKYLLIICLILQSCSFSVPLRSRGPSSSQTANLKDFKTQFLIFKGKLLGSEKDATCGKDQLEDDFKKLMASLKKDSCAEDDFTINKDEFIQKKCPRIKVEGYFDRVVKKTIAEEKAKRPLTYFKNGPDAEFAKYINEAEGYLKQVNSLIGDENYAVDERVELIAAYVDGVLFPIRDLVIIKRAYQVSSDDGSQYYKKLQPIIPTAFESNLTTEQIGMLTQGPNPETSPFYMELIPLNDQIFQLTFSAAEIVRHDVVTLLKAPSAKNYVLALKWMTLHMMLSQVHLYDTILETKSALKIPNACQTQFNGNLPPEFNFKFEEGVGDQFLENILAGHGLIFKNDDSAYLDYYVDNINKDPTKEGYSGIVPFENYKNARMSLVEQNGRLAISRPQFDDVAHFQTIMGFKTSDALNVFKGKIEEVRRFGKKSENITYAGEKTFQNILGTFSTDEIAEITLKDGSVQQIYPGKQNLSLFLLELMKENGIVDYTDLITPKLKKKFEGRKALIDFPSMYSSPVWRDWSLKVLADVFYEYKDMPESSALHKIVIGECSKMSVSPEIKELCTGNRVRNIESILSEFRSGEKYIPTRRLEEKKFQNIYPLLGSLWKTLRDYTELLPEAKPFELNFLLDQMSAGNPWARLKFSYMVALDRLEHQKEGNAPSYELSGFWFKTNEKAKCEDKNIELQYSKISKAGSALGLNLPLTYNHADKILTINEKKFIWKNIIDDMNHRNAQLFSVKSGAKDYYKIVDDISYRTILSEESALNSGISLSNKTRQEFKRISASNQGQVSSFFLNLYKVRNDIERQKKLFEEFSKVNGIDNTFNLKLNFLAVDESYKKPMYKDILQQAAMSRKMQIASQLEKFCKMNINDEAEFKNIFYSASKAQNELNQMAGLPAIPEEVLKKINEMSPDEFRDMWWGIGSGIAGMAAVIVGGACTVVSGGLCAPLGGTMAVAGMASIGIQIKLTSNELERKLDADISEKKIKEMEDLGFANIGSSDEVHRSYAWTAFEAISIFPLIGIATRSVSLGPKLVAVSANSIMHKTGKVAFKSAIKTAVAEEEVRTARYLLGLDSVSQNLGLDKKSLDLAKDKIDRIRKLYTAGEIDLETMITKIGKVINPIKQAKLATARIIKKETGKVYVKESKDQIDRHTASVISKYFADNPKEMARLLQSYSGERLDRAIKIMNEVKSREKIGGRIPIFSNTKDWFLKMRNESLAKNASKILRIEKELSLLGSKTGELENYIAKNIEDLTDIFIDIPMRKRELPYVVQIQGMPDFTFFQGRKIPLLSMMSEGQTLKKVFNARARLVYESYKTEARATLKLKRFVQAETTLGAFKSFQLSIAELAGRKSESEAAQIMSEYRQLEEKFASRLFAKYKESSSSMDYKTFKMLITNPTTIKDRALSEAIWESVPADDLMGMKEVQTLAHKAVQDLAGYNDIDSFQRYINALRILVINRTPAVLEIM